MRPPPICTSPSAPNPGLRPLRSTEPTLLYGTQSPCLQHLPLGGAHTPSLAPGGSSLSHLPQLCGTCPVGRLCGYLRRVNTAGSSCQQSWAGSSLEMSLSPATCSSCSPSPTPPYLSRPSWDPGEPSSWWTPGACSPIPGMRGTWSLRWIRETES